MCELTGFLDLSLKKEMAWLLHWIWGRLRHLNKIRKKEREKLMLGEKPVVSYTERCYTLGNTG